MKKVIYITEYSKRSGAGHYYRYISIKQLFIKEWKIDLCLNSKKPIIKSKYNWNNNIGNSVFLKKINKFDIIIIDSFLINKRLSSFLDESRICTIFIDDYIKRKYQNSLHVDWTFGLRNKIKTNKLFGKKFCLVRRQFLNKKYTIKSKKKLFVSCMFGGSDIKNLSKILYKKINIFKINNIKITFLINKNYPSYKIMSNKPNVFHNLNIEKIIKIFLKSDVVISTSGQSLYELAALKIPTLSICINKNQKMDAISFKREKLIENIFLKERKLLLENIILELRKFKKARFRKNINRKLNKYKFDGKLLKKKIEKYVSEYYSS